MDASSAKDAPRAGGGAGVGAGGNPAEARPIGEVGEATEAERLPSGIAEFDRVLGAGLVPGSAVLVGGDPGIGKSTLMLQAALRLAVGGTRVLYATSEESAAQLRMRAERLAPASGVAEGGGLPAELFALADTNLARITEQARRLKPRVVVIDSIQMVYRGDLEAAPGSVTQLRACTLELVYAAKEAGWAVVLVGHVTKAGTLAGPKLLEHMVDAVLTFEGDRYHAHRVVRAVKNRFGNTLEVGLFHMTGAGLEEVADAGGLLAETYQAGPGSVVCPVLTGSRCLMVELQALTATGFLGSAKRKAAGVDGNRLAMLIAVLEKRAELRLADQDVFTSSVGGMKVTEPASDLALAMAIAGAHLNRGVGGPGRGGEGGAVAAVGEIGLGGEVRHVAQLDRRLAEAGRLGFGKVLTPKGGKKAAPRGLEIVEVGSIEAALAQLD
ncbi:DNA repair protein RadA/Sms [Phycisphaera mikurensis]|nr:DNA repair protein RadA/Sms [Phycisphaera mikurensis]